MASYYQCKRLDTDSAELGLMVTPSPYGNQDEISLRPSGDNLPIYARDAEIASGTVEHCIAFLYGLRTGLNYAKFLGFNRAVAEAKYVKQEADRKLKYDQQKTMSILKHGENKEPAFPENKIK